ncbi:hypothetical protein HPO96_18500 [Kribbella sandramycini]|uniref:Uncharacterized protein n=1 Tax=Kribbella sandramycini TaxID=60450 RepID=A0A7Y4L0U6_9ACTN|nr:hypothetical protein [Kribbella sandramycini]MBB6564536.1 hypothetical protein [Kribbella sandramycini]NOL42240.1 hypothetical protein [Kribbella sandramycini]
MTLPMNHYRAALAELGQSDHVVQVDDRVDALWQQAVQVFGPGLDDQQHALLPIVVSPDLTAPPDLDITAQLDRIERHVRGDQPEPATPSRWHSARWTLTVWLGAALLTALLLGMTVTGLTVVPAFVPALVVGGLLLLAGPGRVPGWIWALGLASLSLILLSGSPPSDPSPLPVQPQWFLGVLFVLLAVGFARGLQLSGRRRLARKEQVTPAEELAAERRPLEFLLTLSLFGAMTAGAEVAVLIIITSVLGLLRRRPWTSVLAAVTALLTLLISIRDAGRGYDPDWAHPIVIAALAAFWAVATWYRPWRHRLSRTERMLSLAGRTAAAGYRSIGVPVFTAAPTQAPVQQAVPDKYPKGQFGRYCASCTGTTAHVSRGLSSPQCVQCGSRAAGGSAGDRTYPDYCAPCGGTTPHTSRGCVVCPGGR